MVLLIQMKINDEEIESIISLPQELISNKEIINLLINEINLLKEPKNQNKNIILNKEKEDITKKITDLENANKEMNKKLNDIIKSNEEFNNKMNDLIKLNKKKDNKIKELEHKIDIINNVYIGEIENTRTVIGQIFSNDDEYKKKFLDFESKINKLLEQNNKNNNIIIKKKENFENKIIENNKINDNINYKNDIIGDDNEDNFVGNPAKLEFNDIIVKDHSCGGLLNNFDVFKGLKDNIEYIIYNNKNNFYLEIVKIKDKELIKSLKGHDNIVTVIKYYKQNNKKDYILSCDKNKKVIIWDIQNDFEQKYIINEKYIGLIWDALILFDVFNNNYILLSSGKNECSKLYEFKNNTPLIKQFDQSKNNGTEFIIHWKYENNHYIIECQVNRIFIYNLFEENQNFIFNTTGKHRSGLLFRNIFLLTSYNDNNIIRIWDLTKKQLINEIKHNESKNGYDIISWNNEFIIFATDSRIYIDNIEEAKPVANISKQVIGIKKIKIKGLEECLICSDNSGNIGLFMLKKN